MGRLKVDRIKNVKCGTTVALASLTSYTVKLLHSADVADKVSSKLFLFFESKLGDYQETNCVLQQEINRLKTEKKVLYNKISQEEEKSQLLSKEAQRLQHQLEVIREVLRDNDIDKARDRLKVLEMNSFTELPITPRNGRTEHSAGSLLHPDNVSSGSELSNDFDFHLQDSKLNRSSNSCKKNKSKAGILRRSMRLSAAKRQSFSFLGLKSSKNDNVTFNKASSSAIFRTRTSSDSYDSNSYQDVSFQRSDLVPSLLTNRCSGKATVPPITSTDEGDVTSLASSATEGSHETEFCSPSGPTTQSATYLTMSTSRLARPHQFTSRKALRFEMCCSCGKRISFGKVAFKCAVCQLVVHPTCRNSLKQRCVAPPLASLEAPFSSPRRAYPDQRTPTLVRNSKVATSAAMTPLARRRAATWHSIILSSLCPVEEFPQIPAIVIHCVNEVAARGLVQVGIYRISGAEKRVFDLFDKFIHGRSTPSLALVDDIHVICSCLKVFLRALDEPLVTYDLRPEFVAAANLKSDEDAARFRVAALLERLPMCYRDTLAFIILHLKAVSRAPACRMDTENLCKVFGPTLVGYSSPDPLPIQVVNEVVGQQSVVRLLLSVPDAVYSSVLA